MTDIREYVKLSQNVVDGKPGSKEEFFKRITSDITVEEHRKLTIDMLCSLGVRDPLEYTGIIAAALVQGELPQL